MELSIIIPTFNDANHIDHLIKNILKYSENRQIEIIVVDGGSKDLTVRKAKELNAIVLDSPKSGMSARLNHGAASAQGKVLYFVNADTAIHPDFFTDIRTALFNGYKAGCYRILFDSQLPLLKLGGYLTRFNESMFRSRDQTMFITRDLFDKLHGFDENFEVAKYYDIVSRIKKTARFRVIPKDIIISAKKYEKKNFLRIKFAELAALTMYYLKVSPVRISKVFKSILEEK